METNTLSDSTTTSNDVDSTPPGLTQFTCPLCEKTAWAKSDVQLLCGDCYEQNAAISVMSVSSIDFSTQKGIFLTFAQMLLGLADNPYQPPKQFIMNWQQFIKPMLCLLVGKQEPELPLVDIDSPLGPLAPPVDGGPRSASLFMMVAVEVARRNWGDEALRKPAITARLLKYIKSLIQHGEPNKGGRPRKPETIEMTDLFLTDARGPSGFKRFIDAELADEDQSDRQKRKTKWNRIYARVRNDIYSTFINPTLDECDLPPQLRKNKAVLKAIRSKVWSAIVDKSLRIPNIEHFVRRELRDLE